MLPSLGALSLGAPTGAKDDVVTEIRDERAEALHKAWEVAEEEQEEAEALGPQLEELRAKEQALRETYRSEKRAAIVRKEVFDNEDLVKEVLLALDDGDDVWDVCKMVARWCSLNKARRAACDDDFYSDLGERIWGDVIHEGWLGPYADDRFRELCKSEHAVRTGKDGLGHGAAWLSHVKRIVLAAIAASSTSLENKYDLLARASKELRDDEDVVRAAVAKDPRSIQFASPRLQALINPLRPTFYWPLDSPTAAPRNPTEFERQWGDAVLRILLYSNWDDLTVKKIWLQLANEHPEVGLDYFRITHRTELKRLVDWLMLHIRENIRLGAL
jgi:hypothetical protein